MFSSGDQDIGQERMYSELSGKPTRLKEIETWLIWCKPSVILYQNPMITFAEARGVASGDRPTSQGLCTDHDKQESP